MERLDVGGPAFFGTPFLRWIQRENMKRTPGVNGPAGEPFWAFPKGKGPFPLDPHSPCPFPRPFGPFLEKPLGIWPLPSVGAPHSCGMGQCPASGEALTEAFVQGLPQAGVPEAKSAWAGEVLPGDAFLRKVFQVAEFSAQAPQFARRAWHLAKAGPIGLPRASTRSRNCLCLRPLNRPGNFVPQTGPRASSSVSREAVPLVMPNKGPLVLSPAMFLVVANSTSWVVVVPPPGSHEIRPCRR